MKLKPFITNYFQQYVEIEDKILFALIGFTTLLGTAYIVFNHFVTHYTGIFYIPTLWLKISLVMLPLLFIGMYARKVSPRIGYLTRSYTLYFFIVLALGLLTTGIQYTPFPRIDHFLAGVDQNMGFHSISLLNWTYAHPHIKNFFNAAYESIGYQLFIIPLLFAFWQDKKSVETYLLAVSLSFLIGTTIYYFLPTAGPTAVFHSKNFQFYQHDTFIKFYDVHHRIPVPTSNGGMISFPSFHVTWAILLTYACRYKKWIFYPAIVFNTFVILSTLFLGWHYLTDVFAAFVLSALSIFLAEFIYRRYIPKTR